MKRVLIGTLIFVIYLACVIAGAFALHFSEGRFALFCVVLGLLGGAAIAISVWYMSRMGDGSDQSNAPEVANLDALLRDADRKIRASRLGVRSLAAAQIIYIVGDDNSAKTQTVLQSGLDAELLAGNLLRDGVVAPTELVNIWLAGSSVIVEAGGALLRQPPLWQRLIKSTRPRHLGSVFARSSTQPSRAVVVCVSTERLPSPGEAGYNRDQIRVSAQALNERLRQLSQVLGISVPVYVLFTKLDTLAHFAEYVDRLSMDEVKVPLGSLLAKVEAGSGLFAERASAMISARLDELIYSLAGFRLEALSRGGELKTLANAYEFPRDLQKRRATIVDFLVELTRPSQLGENPFLRGFFFSGMRAVIVEEAAASLAQPQPNLRFDADATSVFSVKQPPQQSLRSVSSRVPQWAFLPHLFSNLLLKDKSGLEASRVSNRTNLLKRVLMGCLSLCLLSYFASLTISFFNNRNIEQQIAAAAAIPVSPPGPNQVASTYGLQTLDQLGSLLLTLDSYRKDGPPWMNRWGLYSGNALYPIACNVYSTRFRALLLAPTQSNILAHLRGLQAPPPAGADYTGAYTPLKAYLISTSNPEKSAVDPAFLAPALTTAWAGQNSPGADLTSLARTQFSTYASLLVEPQSCMSSTGGQPDSVTVDHARDYLNGFSGFQHVYESMLAAAARQPNTPPIRFNDIFRESVRYMDDSYQVPPGFTKPGFSFMQNAIQHPEPYYSGEEWVLGPLAGPPTDRPALIDQLQKKYISDYLDHWRKYLNTARFATFQNWKDADEKLNIIASPSSPILQLFSLISTNTGVAQPEIADAFQAPHAIVPPTMPADRFKGPFGESYINALGGLATAVKMMAQNSLTANDPAAVIPVQQAAIQAGQLTKSLSNAFDPDTEGKMNLVSANRLEDPIDAVNKLIERQVKNGPNQDGAAFCMQANNVLGKFPFSRKSAVEATPDEVAALFTPGQGALGRFTTKLSQLIILQNGQWVKNPATTLAVDQGFLYFVNGAQRVTSALFPAGGNQPTLSFTLKESKTVPDAVLSIDSQQVTAGQTVPFRWSSSPESKIIFTTAQKPNTIATGTWSVFHLGLDAARPGPNSILPSVLSNGRSTETVPFEVGGSAAFLLDQHFMERLRCVPTVLKP